MNRSVVIASSVSFVAAAALVGQLAADFRFMPLTPPPKIEPLIAMPIGGGADIIVGAVNGVQNWGGLNGMAAYSLGRTNCNVGTVNLAVQQFTNQHHLGAQNIYRYEVSDGASRLEQLGQSWLQHGVCDLQQILCGPCTPAGGGCASALGVGCSSPTTAARSGTQNGLGPRYDINASTGVFTIVPPSVPITTLPGNILGKRIQVATSEFSPALHPGAEFFAEGLTVHPQDATAGNAADNASHRRLTVGGLTGTPPHQFYTLATSGPTIQMLPSLYAWQTIDPTVQIVAVDVPDDGRFYLGFDVTDLGDGTWHYEYATVNISSHRSGQAFSVPIPEGVIVTNIGFKDVDYHTQELLQPQFQVDNIDWSATVADGALTWSTSEYTGPTSGGGNENTANALRWATMYNFRFDADAPPTVASATLALFRPGAPDTVSVELLGPGAPPPCPADLSGDGIVNGIDLALLLGAWGNCPLNSICGCPADLDCSGAIDGFDLATLLAAWGNC